MTVGELVAALQVQPADARVVVLGYENGYDDVTSVRQIAIAPVENAEWYNGRYDVPDPSGTGLMEQAVLVYGRDREE